ncbi:RsmB/NOP family class I SAM-dependent RNA methyltransferase [Alysiella filiformis]|uniref:16S rRNA (Cytosine967-C5)-methyltransferase n=1 Tax=Alysiella filiformis DSM 16848 TaxID=1120981 RepID=A0A286EFC2_9NEIS|nr:RsmB/NOP family class I SAM-dependent RNA methyltransferase [Alysiella filiformis]QMT30669.1 RsmB/NOP family class I SAM-dependent RNA methyltransferase [Alysiella filiformis]UBQ56353.1 RsmB/NOP family class I SAM-dependent RNA methyltransferase [Alysiella filiformis DSM 16848]SOD69625.1 16S rRNA (cytosine967-C5)-methyltransferase [Alysiella filiformis DSM 16848]
MNATQLQHSSQVLTDILTFRQPADAVLSHYFKNHKKLGRQDRHEIAETAFAALRHYQKIAAILRRPHVQARKAALIALVLGRGFNISQLHDLLEEGEGDFLAEVKSRKTEFSGSLNTFAELPEWLIARLQVHWENEQIQTFGRSVAQTAPLDVRVNTLKGKRDKILAQLQSEFPQAIATPYAPHGIRFPNKPALNKHELFLDGTLEVQDEGSQILAQLVGAKRSEIVVDFCAGAGGKTLAMGAQMANKGRIYAFDVSEKRLANLKPRMARAGLSNITPERIESEHDPRIAKLHGKADRVLVDAPCSGLGTLRRNPDLKYRQSPETIDNLLRQQQSILQAASALVREGGRLVYATCSVLPEENEMQIAEFLDKNPQFELLDCGEILAAQKVDLNTGKFLQMDTAQHNTDGFFAAVLQRK